MPESTRFFQPEISIVLWVPTIANRDAPTRAELNAGIDITGEIADISGWLASAGYIDTPDFKRRFVARIGGRITAPDSSITFYGSQDGEDIRTILARGDRGNVVFMDGGDVPTQPMDVFPVDVASIGKQRSTSEQAFQIPVNFGITQPPSEDVPIPGAA
jgi:hypothetical protein